MALPPTRPGATCLITGASSGIGAELARGLAARGHGVTLVARREDRLRELAAELTEVHGVLAEVIAADVSTNEGRADLAAAIGERRLDVEVLVNNAGFGSGGRFTDLDGEREAQMVRTNVEAVVALSAAYLPAMVERARGAVLNVGSSAGFQPFPGHATYAATKSFVNTFSEALHQELKGTGVTCTVLCPGPVKTEFFDAQPAAYEAAPKPLRISAAAVARQAVDAMLAGRRVVVPGVMAKSLVTQARFAPRPILLPIWDRVMRGVVR
jgi:short-subunit dehydrogenase